jgi:CyaY protein
MTDTEFEQLFAKTLTHIEEILEAIDNIEVEAGISDILTLTFNNRSKIIISKQTPLQQLWIAAKAGGFHLNYDGATWKTNSTQNSEELFELLSRLCTEQANQSIKLSRL